MRAFLRALAIWLALATPAWSTGTIPLAMSQQFNINGQPLGGCLLYIFQSGTTATLQQIYQDFGQTVTFPNPLQCDATGRLPMFWLADGTVHVRLTTSAGVAVLDVPILQTIGPSSGGGGGGGVDPNTLASTGDIKFRASAETLTGWVKLNQQTIGSATSGATGRANADTQNLFVYLWNNCPDAHCPVIGGRGGTGLADFQANKAITLPDMRSRAPFGRDQMESAAPVGRLLASNVCCGDGVDTAQGAGGEANHTLSVTELAAHSHLVTDPGHVHSIFDPGHNHTATDSGHSHSITDLSHTHTVPVQQSGTPGAVTNAAGGGWGGTNVTSSASFTGITSTNSGNASISVANNTTGIQVQNAGTGVSTQNTGSGAAHNTMAPFLLGSWYMKL